MRYTRDEMLYAEFAIDTSDYYDPPRGPISELDTWVSTAAKAVEIAEPPEMEKAITQLVAFYPKTKTNWSLRRNKDYLVAMLETLNKDASPGYPWSLYYKTIGEVLRDPEALRKLIFDTIVRLEILGKIDPGTLEEAIIQDRTFGYKHGLTDPNHRHKKKEPTPIRKIVENSSRAVNAQSVVDQFVEKLLFSAQDTAELENWRTIPSKPGAGFSDEDCIELEEYFSSQDLNLMTDMRNWDERCPAYLMMAEARMRVLLAIDPHPDWVRAVLNVAVLNIYRLTILSDGTIYYRENPGGQSSGRKSTSSGNSRMRALLSMLLACRFNYRFAAATMGDDAVEHLPSDFSLDEFVKQMETLGVDVKPPTRHNEEDGYEFCSHSFKKDGVVVPTDVTRMLVRFIASPQTREEAYVSLEGELRHCKDKERLLEFLRAKVVEYQMQTVPKVANMGLHA